MSESKAELSKRLECDALGDVARAFREEIRTKLRAEGRTRKESVEEAWKALGERFPQPEADPPPGPMEPIDLQATGDVTATVLATAELEVTAWTARHGIMLTDQARAELVGGLIGAYWGLGLVKQVPRVGV